MKRIRYEPQVKAAILAAVQDSRKSGKPWADALAAAQHAGYKGNVDGLTQFVRNSAAKTTSTAKKTITTKKKGKTTKAKTKRAVAAPAVQTPAAKPSSAPLDITALVHKAVTDAVVKALEGLVASIKGGK